MRVRALDGSNRRLLEALQRRFPPSYYFFTQDLMEYPDKTSVSLAMEGERLRGSMLVYDDIIVQLRGDRRAVRSLLDGLILEHVEIQAPLDCDDLVARRYAPSMRFGLSIMVRTEKGTTPNGLGIERLSVQDAHDVSSLMRRASPESWWGFSNRTAKRSLETAIWIGVRRQGRLACIGMARAHPYGSHIGIVATSEDSRNQGLATAITDALANEVLRSSPFVMLNVKKRNAAAVRAYSKAGFRPYADFILMRGKKKRRERD